MLTLSNILDPLTEKDFFDNYWEQKILYISRPRSDIYSKIFTLDSVEMLISMIDLRHLDDPLRVVKSQDGNLKIGEIPALPNGTPNIYGLYKLFAEGYTIILNGLHSKWHSVASLCSGLEKTFRHTVGTNMYLTPRSSQGFQAHFDTHDVIVLQLFGSKTWRFYPSELTLPFRDAVQQIEHGDLASPDQEYLVTQGDLLYIPRGVIHDAIATDELSLHLTVGIHVTRWMDVIRQLLIIESENDVHFRKAIPPHFMEVDIDYSQLKDNLTSLLNKLLQSSRTDEAHRQVVNQFMQRKQISIEGHFHALQYVDMISLSTIVKHRKELSCYIYRKGYDEVEMNFNDNWVTGSVILETAFIFIANNDIFKVKDLPDKYTDNAKIVLIKRLIREGLLTIDMEVFRL